MNCLDSVPSISTGVHNVVERLFQAPSSRLRMSHSRARFDNKTLLVSASETRNWALQDPLLDWLRIMLPDVSPGDFVQHLMSQGNQFEKLVLEKLMIMFPDSVKQVVPHDVADSLRGDANRDDENIKTRIIDLAQQTKAYMVDGVRVIYQGCVYSKTHNVYGLTDFLIRSDCVNTVFGSLMDSEDARHRGAGMTDKYHYVIFDTKWSSIGLLTDGVHLNNNRQSVVYKYQLAIYSMCLNEMVKSRIRVAFIVGRKYQYVQHGERRVVDNCFETAARIDFNGDDKHFLKEALQAVNWIRQVHTYGTDWSLYPSPTRTELYPNMKNSHDDPYHDVKVDIASRLREITSVWYCGYEARQACFDKGIYSWDDPRCCAESMAMSGRKVSPVVDAILTVNRSTNDDGVLPSVGGVSASKLHWLDADEKAFIDFEFDAGCVSEDFQTFPRSRLGTMVYTIGVYSKNGYRNFMVSSITREEEHRIFGEMCVYLRELSGGRKLVLYHWGTAEPARVKNLPTEMLNELRSYTWIDMLSQIRSIPIVVRGALSFGLKPFATALKGAGHIQSGWTTLPGGALDTITKIHHFNSLAVAHNTPISQIPGSQLIVDYNETDCRVLSEIHEWLWNRYVVTAMLESPPIVPIPIAVVRDRRGHKRSSDETPVPVRSIAGAELESDPDDSSYDPNGEEAVVEISEDESESPSETSTHQTDSSGEAPHRRATARKPGVVYGLPIPMDEPDEGDLDSIKIEELLKSDEYRALDPHIRDLVLGYIRELGSLRIGCARYLECLNSIQYITGQHPMFFRSNYPKRHHADLTEIEHLHHDRFVTYNHIMEAKIPLNAKADLFDRLIRLHNTNVLSDEFMIEQHKLRNELKHPKNDDFGPQIEQSLYPPAIKEIIYNRLNSINTLRKSDEEYAKMAAWIKAVLAYPIGKTAAVPTDVTNEQKTQLVRDLSDELDRSVHGLQNAKERFMEYFGAQLTTQTRSDRRVLCIVGSPGVGKTKIIQTASKILHRKVIKIELGGMNDIHVLRGHHYTYIGAQAGLIASKITQCGDERPIIIWEEMDKLEDSHRGNGIQDWLMHLFDQLQSGDMIVDEYFGFPQDLSKVMHVISVNDLSRLNPVLRDRIDVITIPDPSVEDKIAIARKFFIPQLELEFGFQGQISITDDVLKTLAGMREEKGVRQMDKDLQNVFARVNLMRLYPDAPKSRLSYAINNFSLPFTVTDDIIRSWLSVSRQTPFYIM